MKRRQGTVVALQLGDQRSLPDNLKLVIENLLAAFGAPCSWAEFIQAFHASSRGVRRRDCLSDARWPLRAAARATALRGARLAGSPRWIGIDIAAVTAGMSGRSSGNWSRSATAKVKAILR
jgi:hypothetical protein